MKHALIIIVMLLPLSPLTVNGGEGAKVLRYVTNTAFGFGERLDYDITYAFIKAGTATFEVDKKPSTIEGNDCFRVQFLMRSNPDFEFLYYVRDQYVTWLDINGIFPWQFIQRTRERNYKKDYKAIFDQNANKAITSEGTFSVPPFVHDVISAFYYVRTFDLSKTKGGDVIRLQNFFDRKTHDLVVKIHRRERIEVAAGTFNCIVIEPIIESESPFGINGRLLMWMSDDERKIPIKVSTQIPIGSVDAELTHYQGTRGAVTAKVR
jgi:hypothetical protein